MEGLDPLNKQRSDLQLAFPGRMALTDVAVSHALTANHVARGKSVTGLMQTRRVRNMREWRRAWVRSCSMFL